MRGEKVYLRALEPIDVDILFDWENDPANWRVSQTMAPFSRHTLTRFVESEQDIYTHRQIRFMICSHDDRPVGSVDLFDFDPHNLRAGVGILVADPKDRGQGFAKEALALIVHYSFDHLMLKSLFCNVVEDNEISLQLFANRGFETIGLKKSWIKTPEGWKNEYLLQLIKDE